MWALEDRQHVIFLPETSCYWFAASYNCLGDVSQMFSPFPFFLVLSFSPLWKVHVYTTALWESGETMEHLCEEWLEGWESWLRSAKADSPRGRSRNVQALKHFSVFLSLIEEIWSQWGSRRNHHCWEHLLPQRNKRSIIWLWLFISMPKSESCICNRMSLKSWWNDDLGKNNW